MAKTDFYAHTDPNNPGRLPEDGANWQLLIAHLKQTAELARKFTGQFGAEDWGYIAGLLHDLGKYSDDFQEYLRETCDPDSHIETQRGKIDHSTAGAKLINDKIRPVGKLIAHCIAGHHSGLLDGSGPNGSTLTDRLKKDIPSFDMPSDLLETLPEISTPPIALERQRMAFQLYLFVKMLYSALVDADFLDTEAFMDEDRSRQRVCCPDLQSISEIFWRNIAKLQGNARKTSLNRKRNEIYGYCIKAADKEPGLFSLTVPTGGGKTLSSMAFALKHANKYGLQRIIYVIPYTSIIEQNAGVFREFLGKDAVLEHHSNFEPSEEDYKTRLASENWDAPVIVTTTVQFYESFFANKSSRCRKLHNIANSVIILDEVQNIPIDYMMPCIELLRELSDNYKSSIVLCSATQPAIQYRDDFKNGLKNIREIIPQPQKLFDALKRVDTEKIFGKQSCQNIAEKISKEKQVLCIVNTRKQAREIYQILGEGKGNYHLSTFMCPAHRQKKFKEIRQQLKDGNLCKVVSTQLIEAGVDIDFPVVYRAMAGLDSIAQAAGRCNREGKLKRGKVYVFEPEGGYPAGQLTHTANEAIGVVRRAKEEILTLETVKDYFEHWYWTEGDERLDKKKIIDDIRAGVKTLDFPFRSVSEKFRIIDNDTRPVIIPYNDDAQELIGTIDYVEFPGSLIRKLQKYTVQLYSHHWAKLQESGAFEIKADMFPILIRKDLYDDNLGLNIDNLDINPEDLMA